VSCVYSRDICLYSFASISNLRLQRREQSEGASAEPDPPDPSTSEKRALPLYANLNVTPFGGECRVAVRCPRALGGERGFRRRSSSGLLVARREELRE
jgi:hypothetical protein